MYDTSLGGSEHQANVVEMWLDDIRTNIFALLKPNELLISVDLTVSVNVRCICSAAYIIFCCVNSLLFCL